MINVDDELATEYLAECGEHLTTMEAGLLAMEEEGQETDAEVINRVFRAVHSVKGGAGFFDLFKLRELAHHTEDVLSLIRNGEMVPTPPSVRVLLQATDRLRDLIHNPAESNQADILAIVAALSGLHSSDETVVENISPPRLENREMDQPQLVPAVLRTLLVEDDFASRLVLQTFLQRYGECHIATNGREAIDAYRAAWGLEQRYDLVCMDIMMPEMDGCEAVQHIRAFEESQGVLSTRGARIIMTTTVQDIRHVIRSFMELCDSYLVKPIDLTKLLDQMKSFHLIE